MKNKILIILLLFSSIYSQVEQKGWGVTNKDTKLFNNTKFDKKTIYKISKGDTLKIFDENSKYYRVYLEKEDIRKWGWVRKGDLKELALPIVIKKVIEKKEKKLPPKITKSPEVKKEKPLKKQQNTSRKEEKISPKIISQPKEQIKVKLNPQPKINNVANTQESKQPNPLLYVLLVLLGLALLKALVDLFKMNKRYKPIIDVDKEVDKVKKDLESLSKSYKSKKTIYDKLILEVSTLTDNIEMMDNGLYEPHFSFEDSDAYKAEIISIRQEQKQMIRDKEAIPPNYEWTIDGSLSKGKADINRRIRLALRAFNGECDSIMSKARWDNVGSLQKRIYKSEEAINKFLQTLGMYFDSDFVELKVNQLYATHEYREKKHEEKEERRIRAKEEREERKVLMESENLRREAERKEKIYNKALAEAKKDLGLLSGDDIKKQEMKINELEERLKEALEDRERAVSRAQLTKSGHVYVISNIGSFGKGVYKIGLTRRLEPEIRVKELGDASVPFGFDTHAMIYSDDAPALEKQLHGLFSSKRVNLANSRKEYFEVSLNEIKEAVLKINSDVDFISTVESREYLETLSIKAKKENKIEELAKELSEFPDSI